MRIPIYGMGILALVLLLTLSDTKALRTEPTAQANPPAPPLTSLPTPPQQAEPWTPPAGLPDMLVGAATVLFQQGLADPRGCEYREVEVTAGSVWGGAGTVKTHGWVLPAAADARQRFTVCWSGLVYPVQSVGEKADLAKDIDAAIQADEALRAERARRNPNFPFYRYRNATPEGRSVSHDSLLPIKTCLLLRLGEGELARKLWVTWTAGMNANTNDDAVHLNDPYLMLATDWVWARFDRAVCAHMRGDDALSVLDARELTRLQPLVEAVAAARHFPRPNKEDERGQKIVDAPYLGFLKPLPILLADEERRTKEPPRRHVLEAGLAAYPEKDRRIAALIADLDQVAAHQDGQPGGVNLAGDPIVKTLIAEGDDAVEPLIDTLEHDMRLTRSVSFGRDFFNDRILLSVSSAAYVALAGILQTSEFGGEMRRSRQEMAQRIRDFWDKNKGFTPAERWYNTLANDAANPAQWLEAAGKIVQRSNVTSTPGTSFGSSEMIAPAGKNQPTMRGEELRQKTDPSVTELMAKRAVELAGGGAPGSLHMFSLHNACRIALFMSDWDVKASVPTLRSLSRQCMVEMKDGMNGGWTVGILGSYIAKMTAARSSAGDETALPEYADWIITVMPARVEDYLRETLTPLWQYREDPAIIMASERLFGNPQSPWAPPLRLRGPGSGRTADLLLSPLLSNDAFRTSILAALADRQEVGTATVSPDGQLSVKLNADWQPGTWGPVSSIPRTTFGSTTPVRLCDLYAWYLSRVDGLPEMAPYWPEKQRDEAVALCAARLRQYGARYTFGSEFPTHGRAYMPNEAYLAFPLLDHPATPREAAQGLAIFSLADDAARVVQLPAHPLDAKWVTLMKYPREVQYAGPAGSGKKIIYDQDGQVWQAEEEVKAGKVSRFYGFVGKYEIARVPAEEIEFPGGWPWAALSRGVDCQLQTPADARAVPGTFNRALVESTIFTLLLRNRSGLEQAVPTEWCRDRAFRSGISLALSYASVPTSAARQGIPDEAWTTLVPKTIPPFTPGTATRALAPTEQFTACRFDLRDRFNLDKPGFYRLQMTFAGKDGGFAEGKSQELIFIISP